MNGHPASTGRGNSPVRCRITPDCTAVAVGRIASPAPGLFITRALTGPPFGYLTCADHATALVAEMLMAALPAPTREELER